MFRVYCALFLQLLLACGFVAPRGITAKSPGEQDTPAIREDMVKVPVVVRDKQGRLVSDLAQEEIYLSENGYRQAIESFSWQPLIPLTLGLLIDNSGSRRSAKLRAEQEAARAFLRLVVRPGNSVFLIRFDDDPHPLGDLTSDIAQLEMTIDAIYSLNPYGGSAIWDTIALALREKIGNRNGRKAVVIITDGVDRYSRTTFEEVLDLARRTQAVIHPILTPTGDWWDDQLGTRGKLEQLAKKTGTRTFIVRKEAEYRKALENIAEELRGYYLLGFYPSNSKKADRFREIKVKVTRPGLKVLAPEGYYKPGH